MSSLQRPCARDQAEAELQARGAELDELIQVAMRHDLDYPPEMDEFFERMLRLGPDDARALAELWEETIEFLKGYLERELGPGAWSQ